jgi:hypothetical protein
MHPARPLLLLVLLATLLAPLAGCARQAAACEACGRRECRNMTVTVARTDGSALRTCCARCAAHVLEAGPMAAAVTVRDFETAEPLEAARAFFVQGSDVHPCRQVETQPPRDEHGCCLLPAFDRCEPSVVAFGAEAAARAFMAAHGGTLTRWSEISAGSAGS